MQGGIKTQLLVGHVLDQLATLPGESIHCCVTSPPYWGLRDYGTVPQSWSDWRGSLGLEPTPDLYVSHLVSIFREVRRALRSDGTFWLNIGDCYASGSGPKRMYASGSGPKPKDLVGIPWMLAFALRADGWYLRKEIIWAKSAPMPESVTDRPTSAHEHIFLLSKSPRYFYDAEAVKEPAVSTHKSGDNYRRPEQLSRGGRGSDTGWDDIGGTRNMRDVWTLNPAPFAGSHFATFPPEIPRRAISAGTSEKGCCAECGAPWRRIIERTSTAKARGSNASDFRALGSPLQSGISSTTTTTGWEPSCKHDTGVVPATVLDPFFGSGTTGVVAQQLWRSCIGIDLSDKYAQIGRDRMPDGLLYSLEIK